MTSGSSVRHARAGAPRTRSILKPVAKSRSLDWTKILDIPRAVGNLEREASGDWHRDPWGWPENRYLLKKPELMVDRLNEDGVGAVAIVDVPKENFAARPAVVLDPLDRLSYMALVDHFSKALIGDMATHAYGWRLSVEDPASGQYARNGDEWERFRRHLANAADEYEGLLLSDIVSCFASIPVHHMNDMLEQTLPQGRPLDRLLNLLDGWDKTPGRRGLPQRSSASAVLANAYMRDLDLVLQANSKAFSKSSRSGGRPRRGLGGWTTCGYSGMTRRSCVMRRSSFRTKRQASASISIRARRSSSKERMCLSARSRSSIVRSIKNSILRCLLANSRRRTRRELLRCMA